VFLRVLCVVYLCLLSLAHASCSPVCEFYELCIYVSFVCIFFWVVFARVAVYTCLPGHCVLFCMIRFIFVMWCYVIVVCSVFDFCICVYLIFVHVYIFELRGFCAGGCALVRYMFLLRVVLCIFFYFF